MKKQLLAGTAIVAASVFIAGGAVAAEKKKMMKPSISVGGFAEHVVGGVLDSDMTNTPDFAAIDVRNNVEVFFNGSAQMDNGVKVSARVELEGNSHTGGPCGNQTAACQPSAANSDDQIDEMFLQVSGSFGRIIVGPTENVVWKMLVGSSGSWATNVGWNQTFNSGSFVSAANGPAFQTVQMPVAVNGDSEKLSYISPNFGGFQVGVSFTPNEAEDQGANTASDLLHDGLAGAVSYSGKFGGVGVAGGVGISTMQGSADNSKGDDRRWNVSGRLDFGGGFRVSAAYKQVEEPAAKEGYVVDAGIRYISGSNQFSLSGSLGEHTSTGDDTEYRSVVASYARSMGPGVKAFTSLIVNESQNAGATVENSGTVGVVGIFVAF